MTGVAWLRIAGPFRDREISRLKRAGHSILGTQVGSSALKLPEDLRALGCQARLVIAEGRRAVLTVTLAVVGPDQKSMTMDGFTITARDKITPLCADEYDD